MKQTFNIAKNELYSLFYSPIAWVIMILFLVLTSIDYTDALSTFVGFSDRGGFYIQFVKNLTSQIFKNRYTGGEFTGIISNLYLFFPLITMGLISRETKTGTIKLLYSSPVKIREIVLGKFLAIVIFTLALIVLVLFTLIGLSFSLANPDYGHMIASLIGLFLVLCAFASIGLFISSLTSYFVVAAIITFAVFALFSNANDILNNVNIARDITFYLNIQARTRPLIDGLLNTRDILYFLIICGSFLSFTVIKLKAATESISIYKKIGRYAAVIVVAFIIGYISTRPQLIAYWDSTRDQINTITPPTQKTLAQLDEAPLHITVFANILTYSIWRFSPGRQNLVAHGLLDSYIRFKPNMEIEFVYYYAEGPYVYTPPSAEAKTIKERTKEAAKNNNIRLDQVLTLEQVKEIYDVEQENNGNFFLLEYNDKQAVVRVYTDKRFWPFENEWAAGFKQLINRSPKIVFLTGHGERSPFSEREQVSYQLITSAKKYRYSLINQGYTIDTLSLKAHMSIPTNIAALAIVDPDAAYSPESLAKIKTYIAAGGNLFVAAEPSHRTEIAPVLELVGLSLHKGRMVQSNEQMAANVVTAHLTETAQHLAPQFHKYIQGRTKYYGDSVYAVKMKSVMALQYNEDNEFTIKPLLRTREGSTWIKFKPIPRDSLHTTIEHPSGRPSGPFTTAVLMQRPTDGKKQIIIATGDADYLTSPIIFSHNFPPNTKHNYQFGFYSFSQFTYGKFPANTMRPQTDDQLTVGSDGVIYQTVALIYVIPFLMLVMGSVILIRRKRK